MPRLTDRQYLQTHRKLKRFWLHAEGAYADLTPAEQWYLHDYFQLTEDWTEVQLLEHRQQITAEQPSLPHQAGRALAKLDERAAVRALQSVRAAKRPVPVSTGQKRQRGRHHVTVRGLVRPEIDMKKLAQAVVLLAKQEMAEKQDQSPDDNSAGA